MCYASCRRLHQGFTREDTWTTTGSSPLRLRLLFPKPAASFSKTCRLLPENLRSRPQVEEELAAAAEGFLAEEGGRRCFRSRRITEPASSGYRGGGMASPVAAGKEKIGAGGPGKDRVACPGPFLEPDFLLPLVKRRKESHNQKKPRTKQGCRHSRWCTA